MPTLPLLFAVNVIIHTSSLTCSGKRLNTFFSVNIHPQSLNNYVYPITLRWISKYLLLHHYSPSISEYLLRKYLNNIFNILRHSLNSYFSAIILRQCLNNYFSVNIFLQSLNTRFLRHYSPSISKYLYLRQFLP